MSEMCVGSAYYRRGYYSPYNYGRNYYTPSYTPFTAFRSAAPAPTAAAAPAYVPAPAATAAPAYVPAVVQTYAAEVTPIPKTFAKAALTYIKSVGYNDVCSGVVESYLETLANGGNSNDATAAAIGAFRQQKQYSFRTGAVADGGPACLAAEKAVTRAVALNEDPITAATLAFVANSPAAPADDPCANAAAGYVAAISEGAAKEAAFTAAGKGFLSAFQVLNSKGKSLFDGACGEAAMAYLATVGNTSAADIDNITKYFQLDQ